MQNDSKFPYGMMPNAINPVFLPLPFDPGQEGCFRPVLLAIAGRCSPVAKGGMGHPSMENVRLDSHVMMSACPDCKAPMTINLVLLAADCWRCQTSIELTAEQKRELKNSISSITRVINYHFYTLS